MANKPSGRNTTPGRTDSTDLRPTSRADLDSTSNPRFRLERGAVDSLLRSACTALGADAITMAVRQRDLEQLLVCEYDGTVREARGSLSLGLVSNGPTRLSGGRGVLQAAECSSLLGFTPSGYLGAPFGKGRGKLSGGVAAWTRGDRRWGSDEGQLLREVAAACAREVLDEPPAGDPR